MCGVAVWMVIRYGDSQFNGPYFVWGWRRVNGHQIWRLSVQ